MEHIDLSLGQAQFSAVTVYVPQPLQRRITMKNPLKTLAASFAVSATLLTGNAFAAEPLAFEVVVSKPKAGVSLEDLLAADKKMEEQFVVKQKGFKTRQVAVN